LRSGSSYLSRFLDSFITTGKFEEWFNFAIPNYLYDNFYYHDNSGQIIKLPTYAKVPRCQFEKLFEDSDKNQIEKLLPGIKYIHLQRKDVINQTLSNYFANISCKWTFTNKKDLEKYANRRIPYNESYLLKIYKETKENFNQWDNFLKDTPKFDIDYSEITDTKKLSLLLIFLEVNFDKEKLNTALRNVKLIKVERPETEEYANKLRKILYNKI
jgi:hypothetical protein